MICCFDFLFIDAGGADLESLVNEILLDGCLISRFNSLVAVAEDEWHRNRD